MKFNVGDKVRAAPMWIHPSADGEVIKILNGYVVVNWIGINGEWHYTEQQAERLELIKDE